MSRTLVASADGVKLARKALKARNLTQTDFAMEVGLGYTTVSNFLNGKPIYRTNFQEICVFLDLDWRDIAVFGEEAELQELTPLDNLWQQLQLLSSPKEEIIAVLTKEVPALDWLRQENDEVLSLEASHLIELLKYVTERGDYQLWYTDYMVTAR
ncbi:MAG: helix-turn-helix transcriptional regulator [Nostoc sp.]|uniref:helix-turn-helix domain-containing protein n=1 Tax=Nostoc sp. TaxID=1180 RepID=UPI002FF552CF